MRCEMEDPTPTGDKPRYLWPWLLLAAVVLGAILAVVWMSFAVHRLQQYRIPEAPLPATPSHQIQTNAVQAEWRDLLIGGNAENGRKIFFEKPEANCAKCHKVGNQGGDLGPALDGLGAKQNREYLLESLMHPNARTLEGYESVIVLLKSGSGISGLLKNENESELTISTLEDGLVTVKKSEVQVRQKGLSPMPEGLDQLLSRQDLRDLIEFMASLKQ